MPVTFLFKPPFLHPEGQKPQILQSWRFLAVDTLGLAGQE
jgi:hypothetical protein